MPKVKINGVTFEADTQAELDKAVAAFSSSSSTSTKSKKAKPSPKATSHGSEGYKPPKKLTKQDLMALMQEDPSKAMLAAISGELGFELGDMVKQIAGAFTQLQSNLTNTTARLALKEANVEPTEANIKELVDLTTASKGPALSYNLSTLSEVASEAVENEWLTPTKTPSTKTSAKSPEPQAREHALPEGRSTQSPTLTDPDDASSTITEAELEKVMAEMPEDEFFTLLAGAE